MQTSRNFKRHRFGGWRIILSFVLRRVDGRRMISYPLDEKERISRPMNARKQMSCNGFPGGGFCVRNRRNGDGLFAIMNKNVLADVKKNGNTENDAGTAVAG
jgi:hypothetical protein